MVDPLAEANAQSGLKRTGDKETGKVPTSTITAERMTGEDSFGSTATPASATAEVSRSLAISEAAGRDILGALDTLERIARGRGQKLSPRVAVDSP
jgi:hypothetical protein